MMDDITFCVNGWDECGVIRCERHPSNITDKRIPHSYAALYQTEYCPIANANRSYTNDLISRKAAIKALVEELAYKPEGYWDSGLNRYDVEVVLTQVPSVDAVEVRHGRWGKVNECSECGCQPWYERDIRFLHYCPNCGARMDGEQDV